MSDNEVNLLMSVMNEGFKRVEGSICESRKERREQIATIHVRLNEHGERIAALETKVSNGNGGSSFFGGIQTSRIKAFGLAGVIIAVAIGVVILRTMNWL